MRLSIGPAHIIQATLVNDLHWYELNFAMEAKEKKNGKLKSLADFLDRMIELHDKICMEHAQRNFLSKDAKTKMAADIRKEVNAEIHSLGLKGEVIKSQHAQDGAKCDKLWSEVCVLCGDTDCALCTVCFLKCDSKNCNGGQTSKDCKYRKVFKNGGWRQDEMQQNSLYEGSCPICCTDEMYNCKSLPRSLIHSPLGCRLRTGNKVPNMHCRMTVKGMMTRLRSDKPKKTSFKPFWHDLKLKAKYTGTKGAGRGRGNPYAARGALRGRGRSRCQQTDWKSSSLSLGSSSSSRLRRR